MRLFAIFTYIGAAIGFLLLLFAVFGGGSAPQEAALAGMALTFVVIPYCVFSTLARSGGE